MQADCDDPPPGHVPIGQLPNGKCCFIEAGSGMTPIYTDLEFDVYSCVLPLCEIGTVNE